MSHLHRLNLDMDLFHQILKLMLMHTIQFGVIEHLEDLVLLDDQGIRIIYSWCRTNSPRY